MADMAASVLARLKNKAAESGRSYQLCLQLFCQEEFLRRLEKSKYAENLVLKGGLFIYSLTDFDSRVTVDVDFLLRKIPNTPEQLKAILEEIIGVETGNDFVVFEVKDVAAIKKKEKGLSTGEKKMLNNAKQILVSELVLAEHATQEEVEQLVENKITNLTTDGYTKDWKKTLAITAYAETKEQSKLIDNYIKNSEIKFKRIIQVK